MPVTRFIPSPVKRLLKRLAQGSLRIGNPQARPLPPMDCGDLRVQCHVSWPENLAAAWDRLLGDVAAPTTFQSHTWQRGVARFFVPAGRLRLITVHRGEQLLAAVPLHLSNNGWLESAGAAVSDYLDPLIADGQDEVCWKAMLALMSKLWDRSVSGILLRNVRDTAATPAALAAIAPAAGYAVEGTAENEPVVRIALPKSWDEYLAARPKDERIEFRRRLKKAKGEAGAQLVACADAGAFPTALDQALSLMEARGGEKGDAVRQYVRPMLTAIGPQLLAEGRLKLYQLVLQGEPAGAAVAFPAPQGPMVYNTGFDLAKRIWGPGIVGSLMLMRQALAAGATVLDLLRGREEYKYRLGGLDSPLYQIRLTRIRGSGSLIRE